MNLKKADDITIRLVGIVIVVTFVYFMTRFMIWAVQFN